MGQRAGKSLIMAKNLGKTRKGRKGRKSNGRRTHSRLMLSNIFAMKLMYELFAHPSNLNSSPLSLYRYMLTKGTIGFRSNCSGRPSEYLQAMSAVAERPREETLDDLS